MTDNLPFGIDDVMIKEHFPLAPMSTIGIGGTARFAAFPKSADAMCEILSISDKLGIRNVVIGGGSNVIFPDDEYDGVVIFTKSIDNVSIKDDIITASCGARLPYISFISCENELSGAEFLCGIPGSIGGAACMNAGAYGSSFADIFLIGKVYTPSGETVNIDKSAFDFSYRSSLIRKSGCTLLEASLKLKKSSKEKISATIEEYKVSRINSQPINQKSAGSAFLAQNGISAWKYIDGVGMRGACVGGAVISEKHAGFIINRGDATAKDVAELIDKIKYNVFEKYNVELKTELAFIK